MRKTAAQVLDALAAGQMSLDEVATDFAQREWDASPSWDDYGEDFVGANSWATVSADARLTSEQYARLADAVRTGNAPLTSAAEVHTGTMIALVPSVVDAARLAVDGGEPADQLHVTLGCLGEAALIPVEVQRGVLKAVAHCVADRVSVVGNAFAVAMFNPETDGDVVAAGKESCVVLLLSGSQLAPLQEYVMHAVQQVFGAAGMTAHPQHSPWVAHLTLVYTGDADLAYFTDRVGPVTFDRVRVAFGGEVVDLPLGDTSSDGEE